MRAGLGRLLVLVLNLLVMHSGSYAQEKPPKDVPPGKTTQERSFGRILHEVRKQVFSSRIDFMALLSQPSVRQEIGLDDAEAQELFSSNRKMLDEIKQVIDENSKSRSESSGQSVDRDTANVEFAANQAQLISKIAELVRASEKQFIEQLRSNSDYDRFLQIVVQARGNRAIVHEDVAARIGLDSAKLEEIRSVSHACWREHWEGMGERMRELMRNEDDRSLQSSGKRKEARQLVERVEGKVDEALSRRLSSHQLELLNQLRGEPFDLPDDINEFRLPGWSGRRGGTRGEFPDGAPPKGEGPRTGDSQRGEAKQVSDGPRR